MRISDWSSDVCSSDLLRISEHADGHYAALDLDGHCPQAVQALTIDYSLLFDLDRQHRGLLTLQLDDALYTTVLGPQSGEIKVGDSGAPSIWRVFKTYFHEGLSHVWTEIGRAHACTPVTTATLVC